MPNSARSIVRQVIPPRMADEIWSARYDKALPISFNAFELSAVLPAVFYMFRFGQRRGRGAFLKTFAPDGGSVPERRRAATVERVAEVLAASLHFDGFDGGVEQAILGDLLLCFCLENSRHDLGRDKQIQRVAPAHYMASWIDLPTSVANLRFVPEMIVAMLANQKGEYVEPKDVGRTWFAVARGHKENLLLRAFSQGVERHEHNPVNRIGDRFIESDDSVGFDQLLMVRLAQQLGAAPDKLRGKESEKISNQHPIAENAARDFSEDIRRFVRAYAGIVPRHAFVDLLESCIATGMTTVLTSVVEILLEWADTGVVVERQQQRPVSIVVDCSNGVDIRLRGLAERSMDDLMRRIERIPQILMMLRLLDYAAKDNRKIRKQSVPTRPYATAWLDMLGDLLHERHGEASFIHRQMDDYGERLADALEDDYPEAASALRSEGSQPNPIRRLALALTPLLGTDARSSTISMVDSILNIERPNGLAQKRKTTRGAQSTGSRRRVREVRSLVFTDAVLDYLVHLHVLPAGSRAGRRLISLREFLDTIRTRYGFHVDVAPPDMAVSNELLQSNRAILERRLRDLGLLVGVNDAEAMKRLRRASSRERETDVEWTPFHGCLFAQALERVLGTPQPGAMAFLRCLTPDVIAALGADPSFAPTGWQVLRVADQTQTEKRTITADQAVERRESKGDASLLLIDTERAGAGMDGIYSASREVDEATLFREAQRLAGNAITQRHSAADRRYAEQAVRRARGHGGTYGVSRRMELDFLCRVAAGDRSPGAYLHLLGLWPVLDAEDSGATDALNTSRMFVERLLGVAGSSLPPVARIEALRLDRSSEREAGDLERFLHTADTRPLLAALEQLAEKEHLWVGALRTERPADSIRGVELILWRNRNGAIAKWSGLIEEGEDEDPPTLVPQTGCGQGRTRHHPGGEMEDRPGRPREERRRVSGHRPHGHGRGARGARGAPFRAEGWREMSIRQRRFLVA